jgi:hypothetical protein
MLKDFFPKAYYIPFAVRSGQAHSLAINAAGVKFKLGKEFHHDYSDTEASGGENLYEDEDDH